jgi:hypothetical protein
VRPFDSTSAPFLMRRLCDAGKPVSRFAARPAPSSHFKRSPDGPVSDRALCKRICALRYALQTLPHQARRLARWQMGLRFQSRPLPRKLMGVGTLLQKPPSRGKTRRPLAGDSPGKDQSAAAGVEFLRWRPG